MKTSKRDEKPHNREPALFAAADWLIDTAERVIDATWSTIGAGVKGITMGFDTLLMGLSWLPVSPLRKVGLDTAIQRGWVNSVKRLATPQLFRSISYNLNCSFVQLAIKNAINTETNESMEIANILLSHGGILSKDSLYNTGSFLNLTYHPELIRTAIEHDAVHDDLKYDILWKTLDRPTLENHNFAEQMLSVWKDFFKHAQHDAFFHNGLWSNVTRKGSDAVVQKLIECTPQHLLTPLQLFPLFALRTDISVSTFHLLEQRGFDIEEVIDSILNTYSRHPNHQSYVTVSKHAMSVDVWLENNPALKEVVEHAQNMKQNKLLLQSVAVEDPTPKSEVLEPVQRKRKM